MGMDGRGKAASCGVGLVLLVAGMVIWSLSPDGNAVRMSGQQCFDMWNLKVGNIRGGFERAYCRRIPYPDEMNERCQRNRSECPSHVERMRDTLEVTRSECKTWFDGWWGDVAAFYNAEAGYQGAADGLSNFERVCK